MISTEDVRIIAPEGELDIATTRQLAPQLQEAAGDAARPLVVDLSQVSLMDSSALGAVVQAHSRFRRQGRRMAIVVPPASTVSALLNVTRMGDRLPVHPTREAALDAVTGS